MGTENEKKKVPGKSVGRVAQIVYAIEVRDVVNTSWQIMTTANQMVIFKNRNEARRKVENWNYPESSVEREGLRQFQIRYRVRRMELK